MEKDYLAQVTQTRISERERLLSKASELERTAGELNIGPTFSLEARDEMYKDAERIRAMAHDIDGEYMERIEFFLRRGRLSVQNKGDSGQYA